MSIDFRESPEWLVDKVNPKELCAAALSYTVWPEDMVWAIDHVLCHWTMQCAAERREITSTLDLMRCVGWLIDALSKRRPAHTASARWRAFYDILESWRITWTAQQKDPLLKV